MALANSSSRSWSAGSQRRVAGSRPISTPMSVPPARMTARKRPRHARARPPPPRRSTGRRPRRSHRSRRTPTSRPTTVRSTSASTSSRGETSSIAARIRPSSRLRRPRSAASRLWLSANRANSSSPATRIGVERSPVETRSTAATTERSGRGQLGRQGVGGEDRERQHDGDREQQHPADRLVRDLEAEHRPEDQHDQPERGQRQDRRHDERDGEPGPEAQPRGRLRPAARPQSRASLAGRRGLARRCPGVATSR